LLYLFVFEFISFSNRGVLSAASCIIPRVKEMMMMMMMMIIIIIIIIIIELATGHELTTICTLQCCFECRPVLAFYVTLCIFL